MPTFARVIAAIISISSPHALPAVNSKSSHGVMPICHPMRFISGSKRSKVLGIMPLGVCSNCWDILTASRPTASAAPSTRTASITGIAAKDDREIAAYYQLFGQWRGLVQWMDVMEDYFKGDKFTAS